MTGKHKIRRYPLAVSGGHAVGLLLFSAALAAIDQAIKRIVSAYPDGAVLIDISPVFDVVHTMNTGAAFSLFSGNAVLLLVVTTLMLLVIAAFVLFAPKLSAAARFLLAALLGGGIGNWIDRLQTGLVTDYIRLQFVRFPVFNFADICISLSVVGMMFLLLFDRLEYHSGETHGSVH